LPTYSAELLNITEWWLEKHNRMKAESVEISLRS
jgi:hypothetical protein